MLSIQHSPLDDRIFFKEALSLKQAGFEVSQIVCASENGAVYDMGNSNILNPELNLKLEFEGIKTYAIKRPNTITDKLLYKVFKGSFFRNYIDQGVKINADVYHTHEPVSYYLGTKIADITGAKVIFDSHESYTTGTPKEKWILKTQIKKLKYLISANHLTRGYLTGLNPRIKSQVIYNAAQSELYMQTSSPSSNEIVFTHDGYLPFNRGLKTMLTAFLWVHKKYSFTRLKLIGKTTGEEAKFLDEFVRNNELQNVINETGWLKYQEVGKALRGTHIGIIAKTGTTNNIIGGPPIKYYNYTAAGLAVIDVNMPETVRLIEKYENGIIAKENSSAGLAEAMINLIENPELLNTLQSNSKQAFQDLNWSNEAKKLVRFYNHHVL